MACELTPCGAVHFSGAVPGGLQTAPDGTQVYAAGTAVVVQREGKQDTVLQGSDGKVIACLAVARSGNLLATGQRSAVGLSADIAIWDLATGALLHRCCLHKVLWDTAGGAALCGSAAPAVAAAAFFNTRSDRLVTAGRYSLLVWEVAGGKLAPLDVQLGLLQRCFTALVIDEADEILYAATASGDVVTVSLPRRMLRRTGPLPPGKPGKGAAPGSGGPLAKATALALVPGGGPLLVGGAEGRVLVLPRDCPSIDVRAGARCRTPPRRQGCTSPAWMPR